MPRTVYEEDGTSVEVPTQEEIDAMVEQKIGETKAEYDARMKEIEQDINPNWKEAREKIKRLEALEAKGNSVNDAGEIVPVNKALTTEDAQRIADERAIKAMIDAKKEELLSQYGDDDRQVVAKYFEKLSSGENISITNVSKFVSDAARAAGLTGNDGSRPMSINGMPPARETAKKDFADSPEGQGLAAALGINITNKQ